MSISSSSIPETRAGDGLYRLDPFDPVVAPMVASWVRDDHELFWLAPKTQPPLTAAKVAAWPGADGNPLLLRRSRSIQPLGYVELNPMPSQRQHFWMGHCIVDPACRGQGLGGMMVGLMLAEAFRHRSADRVSLVVFPDNVPAIRCYRRAGFADAGVQLKHFETTRREHHMLRMTIDREQYEATIPREPPLP